MAAENVSNKGKPQLLRNYSDDSIGYEEERTISPELLTSNHFNFFDNLVSETNEHFLRDAIIYYTEISSNNKILYQTSAVNMKKTEYIEDLFDCIEDHVSTQRSNSLLLHNVIQDLFSRYKDILVDQLKKRDKPFIELDEFKKFVDFVFQFIGQQYNEDVCSFTTNGNLDDGFVIHMILACIIYFKFILEHGLSESGEIKVHLPKTSIVPEEGIQNVLELVNLERKRMGLIGGKSFLKKLKKKIRKIVMKPVVNNHKTKNKRTHKHVKTTRKGKHTRKQTKHKKRQNRNKSQKKSIQKRAQ